MRFVSVCTSRQRRWLTTFKTNGKKDSKTMWQCPKLNEKSSIWFHASSVQIPNTYHYGAYEAICSCASNVSHECACTNRQFTHMFQCRILSYAMLSNNRNSNIFELNSLKLSTPKQHNFLSNRNHHANWKFSNWSANKNYADAWHTSIVKQKLFCRSIDEWLACEI